MLTMGEATGLVGGTSVRPMPDSAWPRAPEDTALLMALWTCSGLSLATRDVTVMPCVACWCSRRPAALLPPPVLPAEPLGTIVVLTQLAGTPAVCATQQA